MRGFIICLFLVFYVSPGTFAQVQKSVFIPLLKNIEYKSNDPITYTIPNSSMSAQIIPRFFFAYKKFISNEFLRLKHGNRLQNRTQNAKANKVPPVYTNRE